MHAQGCTRRWGSEAFGPLGVPASGGATAALPASCCAAASSCSDPTYPSTPLFPHTEKLLLHAGSGGDVAGLRVRSRGGVPAHSAHILEASMAAGRLTPPLVPAL